MRMLKFCLLAALCLAAAQDLFAAAAVAYWVFYFNYVPQIGLERVVHLQFGYVVNNSPARTLWW